jgi:uncharacterized protein
MTARSAKFFEAMQAYNDGRDEDALRLMEQCAEDGDPVACFLAGLWHHKGEGVPANRERSDKWLERLEELAEHDNAEAQWELEGHYRFGDLFPLSVEKANYWLERAAANGWGAAQNHLGLY